MARVAFLFLKIKIDFGIWRNGDGLGTKSNAVLNIMNIILDI